MWFSYENPTLNDNISCADTQSTNIISKEPNEECAMNIPRFYLLFLQGHVSAIKSIHF